jgi:glucose-1-phosphate cytidylyltransferase
MSHYVRFDYKNFIICTGLGGEQIRNYFTNKKRDWQISMVDTGMENKTGSRLAQINDLLTPYDFFLLTYADTFCDVDIEKEISFHQNHKRMATLLGVHLPTRFLILGQYGDDPAVRGFSEKTIIKKDFINGGFYIFNRSMLKLNSLSSMPQCVLETDILVELVSNRELMFYRHDGIWQYVDSEREQATLSSILHGCPVKKT